MYSSLRILILVVIFSTSCDIYRAFKENKIIIEFLNNEFYNWSISENKIINEYNTLITGENFKSENLWENLNKSILPQVLKLRENISLYTPTHKETEYLKNIFMEKIDILIEGLDMIKKGFENRKNPDTSLIYKGRDKISLVNEYNKKIDEKVQKIIKDYYIKSEQIRKNN